MTETEIELWPGAGSHRAWRLATDVVRCIVSEHGAHVIAVEVLDGGAWHCVSVDYPQRPEPGGCHGATPGRWANRIAGAAFELDGERHVLTPNEGGNQLHGGPDSFADRRWAGHMIESGVGLHLVSPDGDQGYPGELRVTARFRLHTNRLAVDFVAETDAPTVVNLTTHTYWNLAGGGGLDGHELTVTADRVVLVDDENIPVAGPAVSVDRSRFDCRSGVALAAVVADGGFDHCFVVSDDRVPAAVLRHDNGRRIELETDQPGVQVYTGTHLDASHAGVALEPQRIPDAPNRPDLGVAALRPGELYTASSTFSFHVDV